VVSILIIDSFLPFAPGGAFLQLNRVVIRREVPQEVSWRDYLVGAKHNVQGIQLLL